VKKKGPNTEPWGTPVDRIYGGDKWDSKKIVWVLFFRYDARSFRVMPDILKYKESLDKGILWSMVLKAAEKSRRTKAEFFLWSTDKKRSFWIRSRAVSVE